MLPPSLTKRLVNHARPNYVTEGYAADWTGVQLREPAQSIADRIEALMRSLHARSASPSGQQRSQNAPHGASTKRRSSHIAHQRLGVTAQHGRALHTLPQIVESRFTRYRGLRRAVQCAVRKAKCSPLRTLPCTHLTVMFSLPVRTMRAVCATRCGSSQRFGRQ